MELQPTDPYRSDIKLDERIIRYKRLLKDCIFPIHFERCWLETFFPENKADELKLTMEDRHEVFLNCFEAGLVGECGVLKEEEKGHLCAICRIPGTRYHWDVILFAFHLFFPHLFPCTGDVAAYILTSIDAVKLKPNKIKNFSNAHYTFLQKHSRGQEIKNGTQNWMVVDPVYCCYMLGTSLDITQKNLTNVKEKDYPEQVKDQFEIVKNKTKEAVESFFND